MLFRSAGCFLLLPGVNAQVAPMSVDQFEGMKGQRDAASPVSTSIMNQTLCGPSVKQTGGYLKASALSKFFFWLFDSKSHPENDPLVMWLSGGPGCSSQLALFAENGPCTINAYRGGVLSWSKLFFR